MTAEKPVSVQGALWLHSPSQVSGWCMLTERPSHRVTVDVLVDGVPAAAMVAAQRYDGAGDGRHGFTLALPLPLCGPGTRVVEARERNSRVVFGRVVMFAESIAHRLEARLDAVDRAVLHGPRARMKTAKPDQMHGAFAALAAALDRPGETERARARIRRHAPRLALSAQPAWSVIVPGAGGAAAVLERLIAAQPLCDEVAAEILLADDGSDPATLLLAQAVPGLRYMMGRTVAAGDGLNMLAQESKGSILCFVDQAASPGTLLSQLIREPIEQVHISGGATHAIVALADFWQPTLRRGPSTGVALQLPRVWLQAAGGFDTSLSGHAAFADLALKCGLLGLPVIATLDQVSPPPRKRRT